jgi:hypothetical protein
MSQVNNNIRMFIFWFTEHWQLSDPPELAQQHDSHDLPGYQSPPNLQILLMELHGLTQGCSLFHTAGWGNPWKS